MLTYFMKIPVCVAVHSILKDVYSPSVYFRFQPKLTEDINIDESNLDKLHLLCQNAEQFILEHKDVLGAAASSLTRKKRPHQMVHDWFQGHWDKLAHVIQNNSIQFRRKL